MIIIDLQ
jgi:hypothetical protein